MNTRQRAIKFAEEHRATHAQWIEHWRANPPHTPNERVIRQAVGGITHHRAAIRRYDTILRALRAA